MAYIGQMLTYLKTLLLLIAGFVCAAQPLAAEGERAGDFDYYVLSLSWSPTWCAASRERDDAAQCDPARDIGFILHGLWPQYNNGWPSYCRTSKRDPSRAMTRDMADIMGSSGLAWHQWKKHGRCSGLDAASYYDLSRKAWEKINRPQVLRQVDRQISLPPDVIEAAYLEANPSLSQDMVTVTCKSGQFHEVRICLSQKLQFRECGTDVIRDCSQENIDFLPIR